MRVVGCILEYNDRFLLLLRDEAKPHGNTWALPGGKVNTDETDLDAIIREIHEETSYVADPTELDLLGEHEFEDETLDYLPFMFVTFRIVLKKLPNVTLEEKAHTDFRWVTIDECLKIPNLIDDLDKLMYLIGFTD